MNWDLIIIGGGVAGLAAASEVKGIKTLIIEKNNHFGDKLLLSGAGQCNITHSGDIKDYEGKYGGKWRFVKPCLMSFTNEDLINKFRKLDVEMTTLENGKVFPKSLRALDILEALEKEIVKNGVSINKGETVLKIEMLDGYLKVKTTKSDYQTKNIIIATGGITYRKTGSTGDGYRFAKMLDVEVVKARFALSPIYLNEHLLNELSGMSFENASVSHFRNNKKIGDYKGDLLITHFGYSGPLIINNSRYMNPDDELKINFTSFTKREDLDKNLLVILSKDNKKSIKNILGGNFIPKRLTDELFKILKINEETKASELKKDDRKRIINFMYEYKIQIDLVGKEHISMVTAGGIATTEINKKTMASKANSNVYFIGECLDVDGDTGGYNIQFAFSSAVAAIKNIQKEFDL